MEDLYSHVVAQNYAHSFTPYDKKVTHTPRYLNLDVLEFTWVFLFLDTDSLNAVSEVMQLLNLLPE